VLEGDLWLWIIAAKHLVVVDDQSIGHVLEVVARALVSFNNDRYVQILGCLFLLWSKLWSCVVNFEAFYRESTKVWSFAGLLLFSLNHFFDRLFWLGYFFYRYF
jgi:hypothetical protein